MGQNRTEKPTEKKRRDARKKGRIAYSSDASAAVIMGIVLVLIMVLLPVGLRAWRGMLAGFWSADALCGRTDPVAVLRESLAGLTGFALRIMLPAMLGGALAGFMQTGPLCRAVKADVTRVNPVSGLKNIWSIRKLQESVKTLAKFMLTVMVLGWLVFRRVPPLLNTPDTPIESVLLYCAGTTGMVLKTLLALAIGFGVIDYVLQRHWWLKELMMTRREVQQEHKDAEGDPVMKGRRRQMYHDIINQDVASRVSNARMVIVNPTHYAVALQYDERWTGAPRIVAKGFMDSAARIRSMAAENGIPVIRHPALARRLFLLAVDQEVPEELYRAVAELIIYLIGLSETERRKYR